MGRRFKAARLLPLSEGFIMMFSFILGLWIGDSKIFADDGFGNLIAVNVINMGASFGDGVMDDI